jgi:hypothetical protein
MGGGILLKLSLSGGEKDRKPCEEKLKKALDKGRKL